MTNELERMIKDFVNKRKEIKETREMDIEIENHLKESDRRNVLEFASFLDNPHMIESVIEFIQEKGDIYNIKIEDYAPGRFLDPVIESAVFRPEEVCHIRDSKGHNAVLVRTPDCIGILLEHIVDYDKFIVFKLKDLKNGESFENNLKALIAEDNKERGYECMEISLQFKDYDNLEEDIKEISESLSIGDDGIFRLRFKKKELYMSKYNKAHRILIEHMRNENYGALKYDLAFMFSLISVLDHVKNDSKFASLKKEEQDDVIKARGFAINDFKTGLKFLTRKEPDFNFSKFYDDGEFDKIEFAIDIDTIVNIKRLLATILTKW